MQATTSKLKTGFVKLGKKGIWLPVPDDIPEELGIEPEALLRMDFTISINEDKIVIEGRIPSREQRPSNYSPAETGDIQE